MAIKKNAGQDNILTEATPPDEELAELRAQLAGEKARADALQEQLDKKKGQLPGWVITCPNVLFDGKTAGIRFNKGVGFIPGEDESFAKYLCDDFGYSRRFVENYLEDPTVAMEVGNSLSELIQPQYVR